jgi:transcriptional regulator with XRE-family HTH domain
MNKTPDAPRKEKINRAIGVSLKEIRQDQNLTAKELSDLSGISAGMISRIENGLASPSISSLESLALALQTSIISLFREAHSVHTDYTLVRNGEGIKSTRMAGNHSHEFVNLALHSRKELRFQARRVIRVTLLHMSVMVLFLFRCYKGKLFIDTVNSGSLWLLETVSVWTLR